MDVILELPPRNALPWKVESEAINMPGTYLVHCAYGPLAIVLKAPIMSLQPLDETARTLQDALDCLHKVQMIAGDDWREWLDKAKGDKT